MPPSRTSLLSDPSQVYQPAEDTFLLLRAAQKEVTGEDLVLEVGTGSGYIASMISVCRRVVATDINPHAVRTAHNYGIEVIRTDVARGLKSGLFDLIVFNPPYLPTAPSERIDDWLEYALDGGPEGLDVIARFSYRSARTPLGQGSYPPAGLIPERFDRN